MSDHSTNTFLYIQICFHSEMSLPLPIQLCKRFVCSIWDRIVITFRGEYRETALHHSSLSLSKK